MVDSITTAQWISKCNTAKQYYSYLEDQIVLNNDNKDWVTYSRLNRILICKSDCNFIRMLSKGSDFSYNTTSFALNVMKYLSPIASAGCRNYFPVLKSYKTLSVSDLVNNLGS